MKKRIISFATGLVLMSTIISPVVALADKETTTVFSYETYSVSYEIKSSWDNNQIIEVTLTNTGDEPILNWALEYDAESEINGIWNGVIFDSNESSYVIKNSGYNYEILPEDSVTFGYTLTGDNYDVPESISLCSQRKECSIEDYSVSLSVNNDWGIGFTGTVTVQNLSDEPIEAWKLGFDANFEISSVWNAQLLSSDENCYSICSDITTTPIGAGETKTFGFAASKSNDVTPELSDIVLSQVVIDADLSDSGSSDDSSDESSESSDDSSSEYVDDSSSTTDDSSVTDSSNESSEYEEPVVRPQTYTYSVRNEDCAVDEITISMETAEDLEETTTIENIMDKDIMCSGVVGLFGEPFDIETSSEFLSAVLTFKVDKSMLGDTEFDNLMFLWYDEENQHFVELETEHDEESSTVSTTVTHFSKYMLVDAKAWFDNWDSIANKARDLLQPTATAFISSCSDINDPGIDYSLENVPTDERKYLSPANYRKLIKYQLVKTMKKDDLMCLVRALWTNSYSSNDYSHVEKVPCSGGCYLTTDKDELLGNDFWSDPEINEMYLSVNNAYHLLNRSNYNKCIVMITDHDITIDFESHHNYLDDLFRDITFYFAV